MLLACNLRPLMDLFKKKKRSKDAYSVQHLDLSEFVAPSSFPELTEDHRELTGDLIRLLLLLLLVVVVAAVTVTGESSSILAVIVANAGTMKKKTKSDFFLLVCTASNRFHLHLG